MKGITKPAWLIFIFTLLYTLFFGIYFFQRGNFEFLWYVGILILIIVLVVMLHKKYNFSNGILSAISLWGLLHMIGGMDINGVRTYARIIYPIFSSEIAGTSIFRYDQFMHFYVYLIVTCMLFYIIRSYIKKEMPRWMLSSLLVLMGIGIGAINEIVEFMPVLFLEATGVGDYFNTMWDIVFNALGAIVAVMYLSVKRIRKI
ncbi:MAG: DUF2238 domain-containing protein [Nanoarchaeota archaeon]